MSGFASTIKIGPPGDEVELPPSGGGGMTGFSFRLGGRRVDQRTLIQELSSSVLRRHGYAAQVTLQGVPEATMLSIASVSGLVNQELSFVFADAWPLNSEQYTLLTTTTFEMKSTPFLLLDKAYNAISGARQVNLTGVFDTRKIAGGQSGTNRIASTLAGALNRSTWIVTLDTAGTAGATVYVNYTITGALVVLTDEIQVVQRGFTAAGGQAYDVSIRVAGV